MIVEIMKKSILKYILSGQAKTSNIDDENIEDMLKIISLQKSKIKSRIDKFKNLDDNIQPYEIPNNWKWVELKDIALDIYAGGDKPSVFSENKTDENIIPVIANGETNKGIVGYTNKATEIEKSLTVAGRGTIGYSEIRIEPFTPIVRLLVLKFPDKINYEYMQYVFQLLLETGVGSAIKQLTVPMIVNKIIPICPYEEQCRIVEKTKYLFGKLDEIKYIEEELTSLNKEFPSIMKKSILYEAINGKLSNQDDQETVNCELLPKPSNINKPFDIPSNWVWFSHNDLFEIVGGSQPPKSHFSTVMKDNYIQLYQTRDYGPNPQPIFVNKNEVTKFSKKGDIILARYGGSLGKVFWAEEGAYNVALAKVVIKYPEVINIKYLYYYYLADLYQSKVKNGNRSAQAGFSKDDLNDLPFPLPPIKEQQRIVDKIEKILPLCDDIEKLVNIQEV